MQPLKTAACILSDQKRKLTDKIRKPGTTVRFFEPVFKLTMRRGGDEGLRSLGSYRRILVIKLDELGDAVIFTPFIRELRKNAPDARITLVVKPQNHNLFELCPYVDEVLSFDWNIPEDKRYWRALSFARKKLWPGRFELAVVPRWDTDSYHASFLAYFSGAKIRVGYSEDVIPHKRVLNKDFDLLYTHTLRDKTLLHEAERNLHIIEYLGGKIENKSLELWDGEADRAFAESVLNAAPSSGKRKLIAYGIGAGHSKRIWPVKNFIELGKILKKDFEAAFVLLGDKNDKKAALSFADAMGAGVIDLTGKTTLRQAAAMLKNADLFVGNDSGLMHVAAAASCPIVEISCHPINGAEGHYNSPARFGPWRVPYISLQPETTVPPCIDECTAESAHCIKQVEVKKAYSAVCSLISIPCKINI